MQARRRTRWVFWIGACIAMGMVISVAVAWAAMLWAPDPAGPATAVEARWPRRVPAGWPARPQRVFLSSSGLLSGWVAQVQEPATPQPRIFTQQILGAGWPMAALEWEFQVDGYIMRSVTQKWIGAWRLGNWRQLGASADHRGTLPLRPRPVGLAVNTGVYAGALLGCALLAGRGRAWARRRKGRCGACGYDLAGLGAGAACPECGAAAP